METITLEAGAFTSALQEKQLKELAKYETRHIFVPFQAVSHPSLEGREIPPGEIYALDAIKRHAPVWRLPESGAQVLEVTGPNKNVVIYLDEPGPVLTSILQSAGAQGAIEITALKGMQRAQLKALGINEIVFGTPRPTTAAAYRDRMSAIMNQAQKQKGDSAATLASIAAAIFRSIDTCERYCDRILQQTHAEMDTAKTGNKDAKQRYDRRDLRAIEFIGAIPREQQMVALAKEQQQHAALVPVILERMEKRDEQFAELAAGMRDMARAFAANAGGAGGGGAQPAKSGQKKAE